MALTTAQLEQLATEINTDPTAIGYAPHITSGSDNAIADLLNEPRAGITIRRQDISTKELYESIDVADYAALPSNPNATQLSTERRFLAWLSGLQALGRVRLQNDDGTDTPVVKNLLTMFPAGSQTRARIIALATRLGSRAEQLFGANVAVTDDDVAKALRG